MTINPTINLAIPAALLSFNTALAFGNARIHWGEAWSKNTFDMLNNSQMDYINSGDSDYDPWAVYRSEGTIDFPANWQWGVGQDLFDPSATQPGLPPASGGYADAFHQNVPAGVLDWPDFAGEYQTFKDMALANGRYYSTDASGNIYVDGIEDAAHEVDFYDEFAVADPDSSAFDLVFIDTIDGNPPAADGSNLTTITVGGNGDGLKGIFYINANFDANGVGAPPAVTGVDPNGIAESLSKIFLNGVLYAAGTVEMGGNAGVYGTVVAERGFAGGGTPDIYYNSELANGIEISNGNAGSIFNVALITNYGE
jgi:hypothetical protein